MSRHKKSHMKMPNGQIYPEIRFLITEKSLFCGPTHITRTDVRLFWGQTQSLFIRLWDWVSSSWPHSHHTDRRLGVPWEHVEFVQKTRGSDSGNWFGQAVQKLRVCLKPIWELSPL